MNSVFVLSNTKKPLMPCRPARARQLLTAGKAAVYRLHPFTIILKDRGSRDPAAWWTDPQDRDPARPTATGEGEKSRVEQRTEQLRQHRGQRQTPPRR